MRQEANAGMEHWVNVAKFALQNDKSGGFVLNSLQLINMHTTTGQKMMGYVVLKCHLLAGT